jgi:hypothetical protein
MAITPSDHPYRIGVVGADPDEARRRFTAAFAAWEELRARAEQLQRKGSDWTQHE